MSIKKFFDSDTLQLLVYQLDGSSFLSFSHEDIIRESIKYSDTLMNGINSGSSNITLSVKESEKVDTLLAYNGELKVTLKSNDMVVFKGYLSNKTSMTVNSYGIPSVSLTLEDIGTKLFKKELYPDSLVDHYFTGTLTDFVELIKTQLGGLEYSSTEIADETRTISSSISCSSTIESLLKQICLELGYVYYWDAGVLTFYKIPTQAASSQIVSSFAMNGSTAIQVSKSIRKYKTCRVQTDVYETANGILVYRDNSGGSDSGNCEVEIKGNSHYPTLSDTGEPAQYEANDIESGKEIISISNLQPTVKYTGGNVTTTIKQNGAKAITVDLNNTSSATAKVTKLECRADVVRVASTEVVKTSIATQAQESDNVYELECKWIHSKSDCETIAKTICSYFNYCDTTYKFYLKDEDKNYSSSPFNDGLVGKVVTLKEDTISGLLVTVLVVGAVYNTNANYIQYSAVGYSKFNMTADVVSTSTKAQENNKTGLKGDTGNAGNGIAKINEYFAVSSSNSTVPTSWSGSVPTLSAINKYLWNFEEITYTNASPTETSKRVIGVYGDKGDKGEQGIQGLQGEKGEQGIQGEKGDDGKTTYFHIKYSSVASPTSSSQMTETPSTYIGTYVDYTETDSNDPTKYTWSQFKGSQGEQGIAGTNGTNGKTTYLHIKYSNDGGSTFTSNSGEDVGDYIGQCTDFNSADPTTVSSYKWSKIKGETGAKGDTGSRGLQGEQGIQGEKGEKGDIGNTGNGISSITNYYLATSSSSGITREGTSGWTTAIQSVTATKKYLWNYEDVLYTNGNHCYSNACIIGTYGDKGDTGAKGDLGYSIVASISREGKTDDWWSTYCNVGVSTTWDATTEICNKSRVNDLFTVVGTSTTGKAYTATIQVVTVKSYQLYGTSLSLVYSEKGATGDKGETGAKGDKGDVGNGISTIVEYYAVSTSNSSTPSSWSPTVPTLTATNKYLWNYELITYTDSSKKETSKRVIGVYGDKGATGEKGAKGDTGSQGIQGEKGEKGDTGDTGAKGDKGETGETGNGISTITNYYLATSSSSGVTRTGTSGWTTTVQTITSTKKYLWNYEDVLYTNGNHVYSNACIIGTYGEKGEQGSKGDKGDTGSQGIQGEKGDTGEKGDKGDKGEKGKSPVVCILSKDSFVLPSTSSGTVSSSNYASVSTTVSLKQGTQSLTYTTASSLSTKGTFRVTNAASGITNTTVVSSSPNAVVKAQTSSVMSGDFATLTLTISYLDYDGDTGSFTELITITKSKQGSTGLTGAYTIYKYAVNNSTTEPPTTWYDTMQTISSTNPYLWMKVGKVSAGGSDSSATWGNPVLAGTDVSKLIADYNTVNGKVTANTNQITANAESFNSRVSTVEGRVTTAESDILQNSNAIALRVSGNNVTTSNAEIVVGTLDDEGYIQLNAPNVIASGTITANEIQSGTITAKQVDATNLIKSNTFVVSDGGAIKSKTYSESTGFELTAEGKLTAVSATLQKAIIKDASADNLNLVGGKITSDSLETSNVAETITISSSDCIKAYDGSDTERTCWSTNELYYIVTNYTDDQSGTLTRFVYGDTDYTTLGTLKGIALGDGLGFSYDDTSFYFRVRYQIKGSVSSEVQVISVPWDSCVNTTIKIEFNSSSGGVTVQAGKGYSSSSWVGLIPRQATEFSCDKNTVCSVTSGTWNSTTLNSSYVATITKTSITVTNGSTTFSCSNDLYLTQSDFPTFSITGTTKAVGAYVSDLFPKTTSSSKVGSSAQPFGYVYANNIIGSLTGNVNASGTSYRVWGAVAN